MVCEPRMYRSCVSVLVLAALCVAESAEAQPQFQQWWQRALAGGRDGPTIDGISFEYTVDYVYVPSPAALAALRARVANRPEHPERRDLVKFEARLRGEVERVRVRLWRWNGGWRISRDPIGSSASTAPSFWDFVSTERDAWHLTTHTLTVFDARAGDHAVEQHRSAISDSAMSLVLFGNLFAGGTVGHGLTLEPVLDDATGIWRVTSTAKVNEGSIRYAAEGRWDQSAERGWFVRSSLDQLDAHGAVVSGTSYTAEDWRYVDAIDLTLAAVVTERDHTGAARTRHTLASTTPFTSAEFGALTRTPEVHTEDPVRGRVTFTSVMDHRGGATLPAHIGIAVPAERPPGGVSGMRIAGWVTAAGLVILIVVLRTRASGVANRKLERSGACNE